MARAARALDRGQGFGRCVWWAWAAFAAGLAAGLVFGIMEPPAGTRFQMPEGPDLLPLLRHNFTVAACLVAGGALLGIPSLIGVSLNGALVGLFTGRLLAVEGGWKLMAAGVLPHGVLELPAYVLFGAVGAGLGLHVSALLGMDVAQPRGRVMLAGTMMAAAMLLISGLIESYVTPGVVAKVLSTLS